MSDTTLIQRLCTAWTYCGVEQALRFEAAAALEQQAAQIAALRADAERMTTALNKIAERQNSDWPDRCQALVNIARAALRQEQPT